MALLTIYASDDGYIDSSDASYTNARAGTGTKAANDSAATSYVGQRLDGSTRHCYEGFLSFDFNAFGDFAGGDYRVPDAPAIGIYVNSAPGTTAATDFTLNAYWLDWGSSLTTGDWVAGASLTGVTKYSTDAHHAVLDHYLVLAAVASPQVLNNTGPGGINATDFVRAILYSSRHKAGDAPTGNEFLSFAGASTSGTSKDPYLSCEVVLMDPSLATDDLAGAVGPAAAFSRELSAAEVAEVMDLGMTIIDRALDNGTATIEGNVRTAAGTVVPATHVRAGWWLTNLDYMPDASEGPRPLVISGHDVGDLKAGQNVLTIGEDWMFQEIGVRMGELLAISEPTEVTADEESYLDPELPDATDVSEDSGPGEDDGSLDPYGAVPYTPGSTPPAPGWSFDDVKKVWYLKGRTEGY